MSNYDDGVASFWQQSPRDDLGSDAPPGRADVAVVGGGLLGACAAYWLARSGAEVALLERARPASGATGRNGGFVVAGTAEPYHAAVARLGRAVARDVWALTLESRVLLREALAEEAIDCDYREPGHVSLAVDDAQLAEHARAVGALHADGFAAELLDRGELAELLGLPLAPEVLGGLFGPGDGLLHPARLVRGLLAAARRRGAMVCADAPVLALEPDGDGVLVRLQRGVLRAGAAIVAVNAWTARLAPRLADVVVPVRGQVLCYAPAPPLFRVGLGAALTSTGEYWQQAPDGTIVLGGCRDVAAGRDVGVLASDTTPEVQAALETVLPRLFPSLPPLAVARRWAGPMAFTPDYLPIADAAPGLRGAWIVGGFSGHGMPFGMRLGQLLAEAALRRAAPPALAPFRLGRPALAMGQHDQ